MELITMDEKERIAFSKEVELKLTYLKLLRQVDKTPLAHALEFLNKALQVPPERLLDSLQQVLCSFGNTYNQRIPNASTIYFYHLMREYMYLLAFYKKGNDSVWKEHILPQMEQWVVNQYVQEDLCRGIQLVSRFIDRRVQLKEALKKQAELAAQQSEQANPLHEIIPSSFRIAERRKTDVIKVLSFLFDFGCFTQANGQPLNRQKTQFMTDIGKFFDNDFVNYAQIINKAAQEDHFNDIFIDMHEKAKQMIE